MIDKRCSDVPSTMGSVWAGATILVGGFGGAGAPLRLLDDLRGRSVGDLTLIANNAGTVDPGIGALIMAGLVSRLACSFPEVKMGVKPQHVVVGVPIFIRSWVARQRAMKN